MNDICFLQMNLVNVNNCMILSIQFPDGLTNHQTSHRIKFEKSCTSIISPPTLQVPQSDLWSRSNFTSSDHSHHCFTTLESIDQFPSVENPFKLFNLLAHDTREIYDINVLGAVQHERNYDVSRPVRSPRRKKIAVPMVNNSRPIVSKSVHQKSLENYDGDLDYEILLFCRSPYRTIQPLRTSIPTRDLWY